MVTIGTLNAGNMTLGSGGSTPSGHYETRFTLDDGTVETYDIVGDLTIQWMTDNGFFDQTLADPEDPTTLWKKKIVSAEIGTGVTNLKSSPITLFGSPGQMGPFGVCTSLTNVTISDGVTNIGDATFTMCVSLTDVSIPESVTTIGNGTFFSCVALSNIIIPNSVRSIGEHAFEDCQSITSINIPSTITRIES